MSALAEARAYHVVQARVDGCVAAAFAIIECHRTGQPPAQVKALEAELRARLAVEGCWGLSPKLAAEELRYDPLFARRPEAASYEFLRGVLKMVWVVVTLLPGPWLVFLRRGGVYRESAHGRLVPGDLDSETLAGCGAPHHAVVLVGHDGATIWVLDPFHAVDGQPFPVAVDEFARVWSGEIYLPPDA